MTEQINLGLSARPELSGVLEVGQKALSNISAHVIFLSLPHAYPSSGCLSESFLKSLILSGCLRWEEHQQALSKSIGLRLSRGYIHSDKEREVQIAGGFPCPTGPELKCIEAQ